MKRVALVFGLMILLGCLQPAWAESASQANPDEPNFEHDLQWWVPVTLELPVTDKLTTELAVESRFADNLSEYTLRSITPSVSYAPNRHVEFTGAYGWYFNMHPDFESEERLYQQVVLKKEWERVEVAVRSRLEERFLEGTNGASLRNRYMLQFKGPIGKSRWYWVTSDEIHFNLNSQNNGPQRGFNQNRLYVGVGRELNQHLTVEGGYQLRNNHVIDGPDEVEHIIMTRVNYKIR